MDNKVSKTLFDNTVLVLSAAVKLLDTLLDTNNGSVIHELLIRPLSYLSAKLSAMFSTFLSSSSLRSLAASTATDTLALDLIALNFLLTRRVLTSATGFVTLILNEPTAYVPAGVLFTIADKGFVTTNRIRIAPANYTGAAAASDVVSVVSYPMANNQYSAAIPVTCQDSGEVLIGSGATVEIAWSLPLLIAVRLLSPISGGYSAETDAELVARIKLTTVSETQATARILQKRLLRAPYPALSSYAIGGVALTRAAHNYFGITRGGMIDVYVKTQNQPLILDIPVQATTAGTLILGPELAAGIIRVLSVRDLSGTSLTGATVRYTTTELTLSDDLARLSAVQVVLVHDTGIVLGTSYVLQVMRMPGIYENQTYLQLPSTAFIGQSILLYSAVPVMLDIKVGLDSALTLDLALLTLMRLCIMHAVNSSSVGQSIINISDIDKLFLSTFPGSTLRAPCAITAHIPTKEGGDYTFTSLSCVVDIAQRLGLYTWDAPTYYYVTTAANIELVQI